MLFARLTKITFILLITLMMLGIFVSSVSAEPSPKINYQGKLTDNVGLAVPNGTYNMRFYLYNAVGGATTTAIWTEELTGGDRVQVTNGLFSVMLGSTTPLTGVDFNQALYLGVEIGGLGSPVWDGEMSPRKELGTVPAAFESYRLGGVASSSFLRSDVDDTASGLLTLSGGLLSNSSSTIANLTFHTATGTRLIINGESFTDFTGFGLINSGGSLSVSSSSLNLTLEGLTDVSSMTKNFGDLLHWNGSAWADLATSSLKIALSDTIGTLGVTRGGTGITSISTGGLLYGNGANSIAALGIGTTGQILQIAGGVPTWAATSSLGITSWSSGLFDKPAGPLVILVFGDSNTDGIGGSDSSLLAQNSNVHVFATDGAGTWDDSELQWRDVDPNGPLITDLASVPAGEPYIGIVRNSNGSMGYTMADRLQKRTGRDVYLFVVQTGGVTTDYYQPGGGAGKEGMTAIENYFPAAMATVPGTPTKADYVMISIGGNDLNTGMTAPDFAAKWQTMYNHLDTLGIVEVGYTQTFQMEMPHTFPPYTTAEWRGYELLSNANLPDVHFLSSAGYDTSDYIHYVPQAMNSMGKIAADLAISGKTRTRLVPPFLTALLSDLSNYVPYTGATSDLDLGTHLLRATTIGVNKNATSSIGIDVYTDGTTIGQGIRIEGGSATQVGLSTYVTGDSQSRFSLRPDGQMSWGSGSGATDTTLYRLSPGILKTNSIIDVQGIDIMGGALGRTLLGLLFGSPFFGQYDHASNTLPSILFAPASIVTNPSVFGNLPSSAILAGDGSSIPFDVGFGRTAAGVWTAATPTGYADVVTRLSRFNAGSPEGVISAPVGAIAHDTTNGRPYTKMTGTGNTGWVALSINEEDTIITVAATNTPATEKATADYVADGTDDEVQIQAALDSLPSTGGKVVLLPGTFNVGTTTYSDHLIRINKSHTTLTGSGDGTVVKLQDGTVVDSNTRIIGIVGATEVTVSNLKVDGNRSGSSGNTWGIFFESTGDGGRIQGVTVENVSGSAIGILTNTKTITISDSYFYRNDSGVTSLVATNLIITNNTFEENSLGYAIGAFYGVTNSLINNNQFINNGGGENATLNLGSGSVNNIISNNRITATGTVSLITILGGGDDNLLTGNIYENPDATTYVSDSGTGTRYNEWDRRTIITDKARSYDLLSIVGSSTASAASISQLHSTGDIFRLSNASGRVLTVLNGGNVGIGTTTPGYDLVVDGDFQVTGRLYDGLYSAGSFGQILQSTGSGLTWTSTTSLGFLENPFGSSIGPTELASVDFGSFTCNGTTCTVDTDAITSTMLADDTIDFTDISYAHTLASNPAFGANEVFFGSTGILFEGSVADNFEGLLTANITASDKTWTLPNLTGTIALVTSAMTGTFDGNNFASGAVATGDILYGSSAGNISNLAGVATGNVLISGGVSTAPAWGQVGLTTHVTGTLGGTNGGTGLNTISAGQLLIGGAGNTWTQISTTSLGISLSGGDTVITVAATNTPAAEKAAADYIADGTDDEVQIQAALDSLPSTGGKVVLLPGTFNVGTTTYNTYSILINKNNTKLVGSGKSTVIYLQNSTNTFLTSVHSIIAAVGVTGVEISDLKIDGNKANNPGSSVGINIESSSLSLVRGTYIQNVHTAGLFVYLSSSRVSLTDNYVYRSGSGALITFSSNTLVTNNIFEENHISGLRPFFGMSNNTITENNFINNGGGTNASLLFDDSSSGNIARNNKLTATGTASLISLESGATNNVIEGNTFVNPTATTYISDSGTGTRYDQLERKTITTDRASSYNLFSISGSSTASAASISQLHSSGDIFRLANASGRVLTVLNNGNVGIGTSSANSLLTMEKIGFDGEGVIGISQNFKTNNSDDGAVQVGNLFFLEMLNTEAANLTGSLYEIVDDTAFDNFVSGLAVNTSQGSNTNGLNVSIQGLGKTFGVIGVTDGSAGNLAEPAGGFFQTTGTTVGNAIRGYSDSITTATLLSLFQETSDFTGTGLKMNFGNNGGSFSDAASKYLDFKNADTSVFTVSAYGTTTIGTVGATSNLAGLIIGYGGICVDNDGTCTVSTAGLINSVSQATGNSDLAEMYFSGVDLEPGEIVMMTGELSIDRATNDSETPIIGVVSTKPGLTLGFDDESLTEGEEGYPVALSGRVPIKLSTENGPIKKGDQLMLSSIPGVAMKAKGVGTVVGLALEDFDDARMYSDTFINQFGDDIIDPIFDPIYSNSDPRINDGCYYSSGINSDGSLCSPLTSTSTTGQIAEANEIIEAESKEEALARLRLERSRSEELASGQVVQVGQIIMFVKLSHRWADESQLASLGTLFSTTTVSTVGENVEETLLDRLINLANSFIDGVLSIFELKANRVEVKEELCVDGVCINANDLRNMLEAVNSNNQGDYNDNGVAPEPEVILEQEVPEGVSETGVPEEGVQQEGDPTEVTNEEMENDPVPEEPISAEETEVAPST